MTEPTTPPLVLTLPGSESVTVRQVAYRDTGSTRLLMDVYEPPVRATGDRAAVLFVNGYPDPGFRRVMGSAYKDMGATVAWARLAGATGLVGITYENVEPEADARRALDFVVEHAGELGVDADRIALWACSGHAPTALSLMTRPVPSPATAAPRCAAPRCAALLYGYLMDLPGHDEVAAAARQFGFRPGPSSLTALGRIPTLVLRAGQDAMPGLLACTDRFVAAALAGGFPLTLVNHPDGAHAFDTTDSRPESLTVLRSVLDFLSRRLSD